jgi:Flp pilus assembly protein TadD
VEIKTARATSPVHGKRRKSAVFVSVLVVLVAICGARQNPSSSESAAELRTGITLTGKGNFAEAIPHLLAARGHVPDEYAAGFDLALCYAGTRRFQDAIAVLTGMTGGSHDADVYNLLAQAYVGDGQPQKAFAALEKAADLTPRNEKLYLFVADACADSQNYVLGLRVAALGLRSLPQSSRLHYQRAMFFARTDQLDLARPEFDLAAMLEPGGDIAYIAEAQEQLLSGNIYEAIRAGRDGIKNGHESTALLTILGEALIRSGLVPGQPEFREAEAALEKSVSDRPSDAGAQIDLGKLCLMKNNLEEAIAHFEASRRLAPANPAAYSNLAVAYRRRGNPEQARQMLAILSALNQQQEARIAAAPGDHKASYVNDGVK